MSLCLTIQALFHEDQLGVDVYIQIRFPAYRSRGPGSIPRATRFSEKLWVWNWVHPASWVQLGSYLKENVATRKTENTAVGIRHVDHVAPSIRKSRH
jgi:hypothetical protein